MFKKYNKLIRDNIPEICELNGEKAVTEVLGEEEYQKYLKEKLKEETEEFIQSEEASELADLLEVVEALAKAKNVSFEELLALKERKANKNGKFEKRLLLKEVIKLD